MNDLFIRKIIFDRNDVDFQQYPFSIDVIRHFHSLTLEKPVSIFIGENGVGKSTFI